jgi:hypothetical protein
LGVGWQGPSPAMTTSCRRRPASTNFFDHERQSRGWRDFARHDDLRNA